MFILLVLGSDRLVTGFASIYLALRRDMLRVGCNSSGISSMSAIEFARLIKVGRDCCCGVCVEWIVCCLSLYR